MEPEGHWKGDDFYLGDKCIARVREKFNEKGRSQGWYAFGVLGDFILNTEKDLSERPDLAIQRVINWVEHVRDIRRFRG